MNSKCATNPHAGRLGFEFEGEKSAAKCPKCGIESGDIRFGPLLTPLVTIHYDPPSPVPGYGMGYPLCDKSKIVVALNGEQASGEPCAVNCKACKDHADFPKDWVEMDASRVPDVSLMRLGKPVSG